MPKPLRQAIAYIRVSTKNQKEDGFGLELQRHQIEAYARHAGYEIVSTFSDAESGMGTRSIRDSSGVNEAMEAARRTGCPIVVADISRFSRDAPTIHRMILDNDIRVIACDQGSKVPRAVIMASAERSQHHGELLRRLTNQGIGAARNRGVQFGNPKNLPEAQEKGSATNKRRANDRARELAEIIQELREAGCVTTKEIAEALNQRGVLTPRRGSWNAANLRRPLARIEAMEAEAAEEKRRYEGNPNYGAL